MKILLTGSTGMVGSNILDHEKSINYEFLTPTSSELNLLDHDKVYHFLREEKPDLIIHSAGIVGGIQANINSPTRFLIENSEMGLNIISQARKAGVKNFLNLASSCMYPRNLNTPLMENMILTGELEPTNEGYALAKVLTTRLCEYISREDSEFKYRTLIPCNLYGKYDKFDGERSHMIPAVIEKLYRAKVAGIDQIEIWGDGLSRREFMFASDLADFIYIAIENFGKLPSNLNVGLGFDYSVNDYYKTIAEVVGYQGSFSHNLSKPSGMKRKLVSIELLRKFNWKAKTELRDGIQKTFKYYLDRIIKNELSISK